MINSLGQYLKYYRQQQGISLETVARETHIKLQYLQALEDDDLEKLPSDVQAKGFLRLYAGVLHLDVPFVLAVWDGKPINETHSPSGIVENEAIVQGQELHDEIISDETRSLPASDSGELNTYVPTDNDLQVIEEIPSVPEEAQGNSEQATGNDLMADISQRLKNQRKLMNFSLADVEKITHIRIQNLTAMEDSRFDDLPAGVQARGMLQSYAEFLALDADEILGIYAVALQRHWEERHQKTTQVGTGKKRPNTSKNALNIRRILSTDLIIGGVLILVVITIAILSVSKVISTNRSDIFLREGLTQTNIAVLSATPTLTMTPSPTNTQLPTSDVREFPVASTPSGAGTLQNTPENPNARIQIYIIANQRAYLRITADDDVVFNGRVVPGNAYQFFGERQIDLLCGNGSALTLLLIQDQQETDLGTLGNIGEVINMIFRSDVIITPTALPSLTPTITHTPPATQTPEIDDMGPTPTP